jgi:hypothetical protein
MEWFQNFPATSNLIKVQNNSLHYIFFVKLKNNIDYTNYNKSASKISDLGLFKKFTH